MDLTDKERATARSWHEDFRGKTILCGLILVILFSNLLEKYDIVGRLLKPGEKPNVYPSEETVVDGGYDLNNKKRE